MSVCRAPSVSARSIVPCKICVRASEFGRRFLVAVVKSSATKAELACLLSLPYSCLFVVHPLGEAGRSSAYVCVCARSQLCVSIVFLRTTQFAIPDKSYREGTRIFQKFQLKWGPSARAVNIVCVFFLCNGTGSIIVNTRICLTESPRVLSLRVQKESKVIEDKSVPRRELGISPRVYLLYR